MNAVLDIIIVCLVILCVALGYKNGFIKTVMNFLSFIIAFFMARTFSPPFSSFIYSSYIKPNFIAKAAAQIESFLTRNINLDALVKDAKPPDNFVDLLKNYGVGLPDVQKWINEAASKSSSDLHEYVASNLVDPVAQGISYFLAFTVIFIVSLVLLKIITILINKAVEIPVLNLINKTGGLILGILYGLAAGYIFVFLAGLVLPYLAANNVISPVPSEIYEKMPSVIDDTIFFKWFYGHSPVDYIINLRLF